MEQATAVPESPETTTPDAPVAETSPAESQGNDQMWEFARYVHVGPGADDCEGGLDGSCENPSHFHAWCRLPNPFQQASIREKAMAAKARRARQYRDPETDASAILDAEMADLQRLATRTEESKAMLVDDLLSQTFWKDHLTAVRELQAEEEWATIGEDQERLRVLTAMPEGDRPADEFTELTNHIDSYNEAVKNRRDEEQRPQREALEGNSVEDLIGMIRESRITSEADEEFMRIYSMWEWYIGTMKPKDPSKGFPTDRMFGDVNHLQMAAPEIIEALEACFTKLETAMGSKSALGNS